MKKKYPHLPLPSRLFAIYHVVAALCFFLPVVLLADVIRLNDGQIIVGRIQSQTIEGVIILTDRGPIPVKKGQIKRIQYNLSSLQEEQLRDAAAIQESLQWERNLDEILRLRKNEDDGMNEASKSRAKEETEFFSMEKESISKMKRRVALKKSIIAPGWGQYYKGNDYRAAVLPVAFVGSAAALYYARRSYGERSRSYDNRNMLYLTGAYSYHAPALALLYYRAAEHDKQIMQKNVVLLSNAVAALLAVYLYNVADAYLTEPRPDPRVGQRDGQKPRLYFSASLGPGDSFRSQPVQTNLAASSVIVGVTIPLE